MAQRKTREELREMFKQGAKPTGLDFFDFIESVLVAKDDSIENPVDPDKALKIRAKGPEEGLLDFYAPEATGNEKPVWRIYQKPETVENSGLTFADSEYIPRLFIKNNSVNVGIGTKTPEASLDIKDESPEIRLLGESDKKGCIMLRKQDGRYGFDITHDGHANKLHVEGFDTGVSKGKHLTIDRDSGNMGVGKEDPEHKVDVDGAVKATRFIGDGSGLINVPGSGGDSPKIPNLYATDNIGIKTATPYKDLEVNGEIGAETVSCRSLRAEKIHASGEDLLKKIAELEKRIKKLEGK